jgi:Replication-relaxation
VLLPSSSPPAVRPAARPVSPGKAAAPTPREGEVLADVGLWRELTTAQLKRRHYADASLKTCQNGIAKLTAGKYLERRTWGYDPAKRKRREAWRLTAKGYRAAGLPFPPFRGRESELRSIPHDLTVAEVADAVLGGLARAGVAARWTTEEELKFGLTGLPAAWTGLSSRRPDGVLWLPDPERPGAAAAVAVEVDTTQHGAEYLARKVAEYRLALEPGADGTPAAFRSVWWYCVPGGTLRAAEQAIAAAGDPRRMAARPLPKGVTVYTADVA